MKKFALSVVVLAVLAGIGLIYASWPEPVDASSIPDHEASLENGKLLYTVGGCLSCHMPAPGDAGADPSLPSGGAPLKTPIGTFYPPNLTPDNDTGLGNWHAGQFISAMHKGVSPDSQHYLPAFPYTSYAEMTVPDLIDLFAYLKSLPPVRADNRPHDVPAVSVLRLGVGVWKLLAMRRDAFQPDPSRSPAWNRGAYLVNGPGHCGECHTPRNALMIWDMNRFLAGGPHPEGGKAKVPSLRDLDGRKRYKDAKDLVAAFQWGEAFGYEDLSSGGMGAVQTNLAKLPEADLNAIAEYLLTLE